LQSLSQVINKFNFNIAEEVLRTKDSLGMCLVDIEKVDELEPKQYAIFREEIEAFEKEVSALPNCIKTKILF
jgi:hypothetical protein